MSGFTFGAPKSTATVAPSFGASLGSTAAPTFGVPTTNAPAFGATPGAAPTFGQLSGAAPAFGATQGTVSAFGTAPAAAAPAFGAATTGAAPTFGTLTSGAAAFGATTTGAAPAFGTLTAGAPAFGATTTGAAPAFGTTTAAAPAFNFGTNTTAATTTTPTLSFGLTSTTATSSALPMGGLGVGTLSFSKPATTTAAPSFAPTGIGAGFFGKQSAMQQTTTTTAAATSFVGLGGIDVSATQVKGDSKQDNVKVKETQVPDEIAKTVDGLKTYIKTQKTLCSDIGRTSSSKLSNVSSEIADIKYSLQEIANAVDSNANQIKLLRRETTKTIQSVEMAQRTRDTPAGLQFENIAPFQYFQNLVCKYEQDLLNFRQQITSTERHMHSLANPSNVAPDDLKRCFQQINESFISLAGRLHEIHQQVENQKQQYLNLRKYRLRDATNVFAQIEETTQINTGNPRLPTGPTPFSSISTISGLTKSFNQAASATK